MISKKFLVGMAALFMSVSLFFIGCSKEADEGPQDVAGSQGTI